ncbi:MAG: LysE family transporter [Candidatus Pacebacteria bacterium]|jgi:threonine/homoserine/homoserine lactone efflux protein|nr:LysE family transporter [Candidatus Paceibacterota bacterium]
MSLIAQIIGAFTVGFIGGAVPGPILTSAMTESLRNGFAASLRVVFWAMLSESAIALFILTVLSLFDVPQGVFYAISFAGAVVLVWFSRRIWKIRTVDGRGEVFSFKKIFLLMAANGLFWLYWLTVCVPMAFAMRQSVVFGQILFLAFFELGWMISTVAMVFIFSRFRPILVRKNLVAPAFKILAVLFVFFAVKISWESLLYFIN